jgi:hypothetical protein
MRQLQKIVRSALLCGCLCLLAFHQLGDAPASLVRWLGATPQSASLSFSAGGDASATATLACARDGLSRDAELTDRRQLSLVSDVRCRARAVGIQPTRFHNNSRPVVLRTRAVFCDFARLRSILHPQFALIAHTSAVLC